MDKRHPSVKYEVMSPVNDKYFLRGAFWRLFYELETMENPCMSNETVIREFENGVFGVFPVIEHHECDVPFCKCERPDFLYKPTNIMICWYKYPFRGGVINRKPEEYNSKTIIALAEHCLQSLTAK